MEKKEKDKNKIIKQKPSYLLMKWEGSRSHGPTSYRILHNSQTTLSLVGMVLTLLGFRWGCSF